MGADTVGLVELISYRGDGPGVRVETIHERGNTWRRSEGLEVPIEGVGEIDLPITRVDNNIVQ